MARSQEHSLPLFPDEPATPVPRSLPGPSLPARKATSGQLWLALRLPRLALDVFAASEEAVAVVEEQGGRGYLVACNPVAAAGGLSPGMGMNAAFALLPQLRLLEREPQREQASLARLAGWAGQFTSRVSLEPPETLLLEVKGSLRLFGGLSRLQRRIIHGLREMGFLVSPGLAPTPQGALCLSRAPGPRAAVTDPASLAGSLGELPLESLGWDTGANGRLHRLGVRCVADCLRLPRDGFARRFGPARLDQLDRALGRAPDPRADFTAPGRFRGEIELPAETRSSDRLLPALQRLVEELVGLLRSREGGVDALELGLRHAGGQPTRLVLRRLSLTRDRQHLLGLLGQRLEQLSLPAPVLALTLASGPLRPLPGRDRGLLGLAENPDPGAVPMLVERLRARLGEEAVHGLCLVSEHRPEAAWRPGREGRGQAAAAVPGRPLWMLSAPLPLALHEGRPWRGGVLQLESGPERIETGWWDGADVARDYYRARSVRGERLWIYRDRRAPRHWYLHGIFG